MQNSSYLVNVTKADHIAPNSKSSSDDKVQSKKSKLPRNLPIQTINGKSTTEVDVIYVAARHAKEFKNGLQSLGLLDKRYKLIKVDKSESQRNLIAVPVTNECIDQITDADGKFRDPTTSVLGKIHPNCSLDIVFGIGKEVLPYSSSSMSKMKQRKGLH